MMMLTTGARRRGTTPAPGGYSYTVQPLQRIADGVADGLHYGFPGMAVMPDGSFTAVCRRATGHNPGTDPATHGTLVMYRSTDQGETWAGPTVVQEASGLDLRDPTLSVLSDGRLALLYFPYDATIPASTGVRVSYSSNNGATWTTPEVLPFAGSGWTGCSGPIVEPTPGHLMAFGYGGNTGVRMVSSTNNGASWTAQPSFLNTGFAYGTQEPYAAVRPDGLVEVHTRDVFVNGTTPTRRHRTIRQPDGSWSTPELFAEWVTGRPSWAVDLTTGHRLAIDRRNDALYLNHYYTIGEDVDDLLTPWTWVGAPAGGSQYAQPVAHGGGFVAALSITHGVRASLYWTRWVQA